MIKLHRPYGEPFDNVLVLTIGHLDIEWGNRFAILWNGYPIY